MSRGYVSVVIAVALVVAGTAVASGWLFLTVHYGHASSANDFGSQFGFVDAIVSSLALAGIIVTLWMQSRDIAGQQDQLRQTLAAMEAQTRVLQDHTTALSRQTEMITRPYVEIDIWTQPDTVRILRIRNTGRTAALDMRLTIDRSVETMIPNVSPIDDKSSTPRPSTERVDLQKAYIFTHIIPVFAPGASIEFALTTGLELAKVKAGQPGEYSNFPLEFVVNANYRGAEHEYKEVVHLDMKAQDGGIINTDFQLRRLSDIAKNTDAIAKGVARIANRRQ
jgi:hypothetical protein